MGLVEERGLVTERGGDAGLEMEERTSEEVGYRAKTLK